jgi:tetratricopeptide (TPR) repeat protein
MAGNQEKFKKAMNAGHSAAWDQEWKKAAGFYSQALDEFPENPMALSSLGLAFFEMHEYDKSLICYQHAAGVAPKDPVPQEKIARIFERTEKSNEAAQAFLKAAELHLNARDVEKAIDNWRKVLSLLPEHLLTRQRLAAVYERLGKRSEAVDEYIAAASIIQRGGDLTRALRTVEYAAQLMPESADARFALHTIRSSQMLPKPSRPRLTSGDVNPSSIHNAGEREAAAVGKQVDPIEEARQRSMTHIAGLLFEQGDETSSEPAARRGINSITKGKSNTPIGGESSDKSRIILHLSQAIESLSSNDEVQAEKELEKAVDLGLNQPVACFMIGYLLRGRDPARALHFLREALRQPEYALGAYLLSGQLYAQTQMVPQAATAYMQALAVADSELVEMRFADELRQSYEPMIDGLTGETDENVLKNISNTIASQLVRPDWRAYLLLARGQLPQQGPDLPPLPVAEMILESRGGQVVEAVARVRELAAHNLVDTAMEEAFYALQFAPTYLPIHVEIGELLLKDNYVDEAVQKFMFVAELYNARGEPTRAARILKRILQVSPMDLAVHNRLINLLVGQNKIEESLEEYMLLAEIYYNLAELEKARQTYMTALKLVQKANNSRAWGVKVLLKVADIDMQRLNLRQALRIFEQIRTIQPDDLATRVQLVSLNFRLGQAPAAMGEVDGFISLLEGSGRRKQAIVFLNELLNEHGSNLDLRRRLADLYAREGRVPEAVVQLDAVADGYMGEGKMMEAVNMIETIIALRPPNVADYRAALDDLRKRSLRQ